MPYTAEQIAKGEGNTGDRAITPDGRLGYIVGYGYDDFIAGRPFMAFIKLDDGGLREWRTVDPRA